jgi:splicing factor 3B subunit 1
MFLRSLQISQRKKTSIHLPKRSHSRQIASRQSEYHNRKFSRVAQESADAFKPTEDGKEVEGGYKDAMRLARLENEEARVKRAIAEKERKDREEGKMKMDLDKTPSAAEIEDVAKELATTKESSSGTKCKRRWDVSEPTDENVDPNKPDTGEWSKEASAPKKCRSHLDATPADVVVGETPKRSRWDQTLVTTNGTADSPMMPTIMHAPGFMQEGKHNHKLSDEKLDAVLPSSGYSIVTPPPGYAPHGCSTKLMTTPITEVGGFQIQEGCCHRRRCSWPSNRIANRNSGGREPCLLQGGRSYRYLWSAHWRIKSAIYWSKSSTVYIINSTTSSVPTSAKFLSSSSPY